MRRSRATETASVIQSDWLQPSRLWRIRRHGQLASPAYKRMIQSPAAVYADLIVPAKTGEFWRAPKNSPMGFPRCTVLEITEIKTVPYVPLSHPFVERLIGTIRREYLDWVLFWTTADLEMKLSDFQTFYNGHRTHGGVEGRLPEPTAEGSVPPIGLDSYQWRRHCRGLYQTPIAA